MNPKQNFRVESHHLGWGFFEWKSFFFHSKENPLYFMFWRRLRILFLKIVFLTFPMILKTFSHLFFIVKKPLNEWRHSFFIFGEISEPQLDLYLQGIFVVFYFKSVVNELYRGLNPMVRSLWECVVFCIVERTWRRQNFFSLVFGPVQSKTDDLKSIMNPKQNFRVESDHLGWGFFVWKILLFP